MHTFIASLTSRVLAPVAGLAADVLILVLYVLGPFISAASLFALVRWPHLWVPAAALLYVLTYLFFGHLMNVRYALHLQQLRPNGPQELPHGPRQLNAVLLAIGYVLDYLLNAAVFALLMFRIPLELTLSEALNKYGWKPTWKGRVARYFGGVWINPLDHTANAEGKPHIDIGEEAPK
jgi:hypothetical protein